MEYFSARQAEAEVQDEVQAMATNGADISLREKLTETTVARLVPGIAAYCGDSREPNLHRTEGRRPTRSADRRYSGDLNEV
jgi:hypothetical protein